MSRLIELADNAFDHSGRDRGFTHGFFRFPAKMHPPLIRSLIVTYTKIGDSIFDPFAGSGTSLVEAIALGRVGYGVDVDPLAVLISRTKTQAYSPRQLHEYLDGLREHLKVLRRPQSQLQRLASKDLSLRYAERLLRNYNFPSIENRDHWLNRYVAIDLARLMHAIDDNVRPGKYRDFFVTCALATIRKVSRADPVPSSGLEVTRRMLELEAQGRIIDVFAEFTRHASRRIPGAIALSELPCIRTGSVAQLDVRDAAAEDLVSLTCGARVKAIITSPPYLGAIEYSRRFRLERSFLSSCYPERLEHRTIGRRHKIEILNPLDLAMFAWYRELASCNPRAARTATAYFSELIDAMRKSAQTLCPDGLIFLIVGDASLAGRVIPIASAIAILSGSFMTLQDQIDYEIKNRYMSYARRNGEGIRREHLLVFSPKEPPSR